MTLVEYGDYECPYCGQAEAAHAQGAFWPMHDLLIAHPDELRPPDAGAH